MGLFGVWLAAFTSLAEGSLSRCDVISARVNGCALTFSVWLVPSPGDREQGDRGDHELRSVLSQGGGGARVPQHPGPDRSARPQAGDHARGVQAVQTLQRLRGGGTGRGEGPVRESEGGGGGRRQ